MGWVMRFNWVFCVGYGYNLGYSYGMVLMLLHLTKLFLKVFQTYVLSSYYYLFFNTLHPDIMLSSRYIGDSSRRLWETLDTRDNYTKEDLLFYFENQGEVWT